MVIHPPMPMQQQQQFYPHHQFHAQNQLPPQFVGNMPTMQTAGIPQRAGILQAPVPMQQKMPVPPSMLMPPPPPQLHLQRRITAQPPSQLQHHNHTATAMPMQQHAPHVVGELTPPPSQPPPTGSAHRFVLPSAPKPQQLVMNPELLQLQQQMLARQQAAAQLFPHLHGVQHAKPPGPPQPHFVQQPQQKLPQIPLQGPAHSGAGPAHSAAAPPAVNNPLLLLAQHLQQQQQFALMEQAIKKEIYELLASAAASGTNRAPPQAPPTPGPQAPPIPGATAMTALQRTQMLNVLNLLQQQQQQQQMMTPQTPMPMTQQAPMTHMHQHHQFLSPPLTLSPTNSVNNDLLGNGAASGGSAASSPPPAAPIAASGHDQMINDQMLDIDQTLDMELIEKQIAAQHNELSAREAQAVAVLAGFAASGAR